MAAAPSTSVIEQHKGEVDAIIEELLTFINGKENEGWSFVKKKDDVEIWRTKEEGSSLYLMKGYGTIKAPVAEVGELLADFNNFKDFDPMFISGERLEGPVTEGDITYEIPHLCFKSPGPVTNRDFVTFAITKRKGSDGSFIFCSKSIEHPNCPPAKGYVRGELRATGYHVTAIDANTTAIAYVVGVDPKGWVPAFVVNIVAVEQPMNIKRIREYLESGKFKAKKEGK